MMNWLNRQKSSTTASGAVYPQPPLADWRNREKQDIKRNIYPGSDRTTRRSRKLKYLELFSLAVIISLIVGVDLYILGINKRLSALENEFVEVKTWAFPASLLEGKYTSLNARVRALTDAYSSLESKLTSVSLQQRTVGVEARAAENEGLTVPEAETASVTAGVMAANAVTEADIPTEAPAAGNVRSPAGITPESAGTTGVVSRADENTPAVAPVPFESQSVALPDQSADNITPAPHSRQERPAEASGGAPAVAALSQGGDKQGPWVINLLSDPSEALAERFAARARDRGVPVEQNRTEVKGRVYWRVQITGFDTAHEARAHAEGIKEKLRLKDVWIFKQQG